MKTNLLDLDAAAMAQFFAGIDEKPFRSGQVLHWLHQVGQADFSQMTDLSKALRETLSVQAMVELPRCVSTSQSPDGTRKWLLAVGEENAIETVFIPEASRGTLCISSQAGCALECAFCATGKQGFNRNLTTAEIIGQLWWAVRTLSAEPQNARLGESENPKPVSNVVMMGMGEPLANFSNVVRAMRIMLDDHAYGLSRRRVTLSTAGIVPAIDRLREECRSHWRYRCMRPPTSCAMSWCRLTGSTPCASCSRPANVTSMLLSGRKSAARNGSEKVRLAIL